MTPSHRIHQGDAVAFLESLEPGSVDLVITDPAYESLEKHRSKGTTTRLKESKSSSNAWFPIFGDERYPPLLMAMYRAMKPKSHAYVFCDETTADVLKPVTRACGFWVWKSVIWVKATKTTDGVWRQLKPLLASVAVEPSPRKATRLIRDALQQIGPTDLADAVTRTGMGYHWRGACERILFLEKRSTLQTWPRLEPTGKGRALNHNAWKDVLFGTPVLGTDAYPTEKPLSVVEQLVLNSSLEGELVVDPFAGSGVVGEAAHRHQRSFALNDVSTDAIKVMTRRLERMGGRA